MSTPQATIPFLKLGVELEVELKGDPDPTVSHASNYTIYGSYPKHTPIGRTHKKHGSLVALADKATDKIQTHYDNTVNDGWEWVGNPLSLEENLTEWGKLIDHPVLKQYIHGDDVKESIGKGYGTHDCGMHVHVSGDIVTKQTLGNMFVFFNRPKNKEFLECIAGRSLNRFCKQQARARTLDVELLYHSPDCVKTSKRNKKIYHKYDGSFDSNVIETGLPCCRHAADFSHLYYQFERGAIWLLPAGGTGDFEIRIFKSTVNMDKFTVNLQFVTAITEYCSQATESTLDFERFNDWLTSKENKLKYTLLFKFLRKHGYVGGIVPSQMDWLAA